MSHGTASASASKGTAAGEPVTEPGVPRLQPALERVRARARDDELELQGPRAAGAAEVLREGDERAADAGAELAGRRGQQAERAGPHPHAADDLAVAPRHRQLPARDELAQRLGRDPPRARLPQARLAGRVGRVDERQDGGDDRLVAGERDGQP